MPLWETVPVWETLLAWETLCTLISDNTTGNSLPVHMLLAQPVRVCLRVRGVCVCEQSSL